MYSVGLKDVPYLGYVIIQEDIKYDPKKVQEIMNIRQHTATTEERALIYMVQSNRDMWSIWYQILDHLTEAYSIHKNRKYPGTRHYNILLSN